MSDPSLRQRLAARELDWIVPEWDAPANVHAVMTTRHADRVDGVRRSMNLGRISLDAVNVERNRALLREVTGVLPLWLSQTHGIKVAIAGRSPQLTEADAVIATEPGDAAMVRVADCMPVLFASRDARVVGAAHAGWRGLCAGVLEATIDAMRRATDPCTAHDDIVAWMGPAIGPESFEVGDDVRDAFLARDGDAQRAFVPYPGRPGKWLADLYTLARMRLARVGIVAIAGGGYCTVREQERFFSYRRDASIERMAALVWLEPSPDVASGRSPHPTRS